MEEDASAKEAKRAARAARFNTHLPGNRYKELEAARQKELKAAEQNGSIRLGKTQLEDAVDLRGTCEGMCCEYEMEFRESTQDVHPFEAKENTRRIDHSKAVAAYTRSDAGAGHGAAAILPSDLRTPEALVRSLDYLFSTIMPALPASSSDRSPRRALGYSAGFIRDRTRAIRKEFAMQSSWGHEEAIASFERIARWHILCLRELQEETGSNTDMHIDAAELGRCFTSLRQHYNDRREELNVDMPCPNEPEFRAYMLIYELSNKSISIPTSELPSAILDHPIVKLAWDIRRTAQRNFDSQKEGSKFNAELGANLINQYIKLVKQGQVPYLLSCLVEVRLREIRRSAMRALHRAWPRMPVSGPVRTNAAGEIVERRMVLLDVLVKLLGCEEQEQDLPAWDDIIPVSNAPQDEAVAIATRFGYEVYDDGVGVRGVLINKSARYDDNKDAPFPRRWKMISERRQGASYVDIVNGRIGVHLGGAGAPAGKTAQVNGDAGMAFGKRLTQIPSSIPTASLKPTLPSQPSTSAFGGFGGFGKPAPTAGSGAVPAATSAFSFTPKPSASASPAPVPAAAPKPAFSFGKPSAAPVTAAETPASTSASTGGDKAKVIPSFFPSVNGTGTTTPTPAAEATKPKPAFTFGAPAAATAGPSKKRRGSEEDERPAKVATGGPSLFAGLGAPSTPAAKAPSLATVPAPISIPSFFPSTTPATGATTPTPAQPASSAPPSPLTRSHRDPSSLLSSTSTPTKLPPRRSLADIHTSRQKRKAALPALTRTMLEETFLQLIQDNLEQDARKAVEQQRAERRYKEEVAFRKEAIVACAKGAVEEMVREILREVAAEPFLEVIRERAAVRRLLPRWREVVQEAKERRGEGKGKGKDVKKWDAWVGELGRMSLSRSVMGPRRGNSSAGWWGSTTAGSVDGSETDMGWVEETVRPEPLHMDIDLHQQAREREHLDAPSTFLTAIARHTSNLIAPITNSPYWTTVLSVPPEDFGAPPDPQVQQWLVSKFMPPRGDTTPAQTPGLDGEGEGDGEGDEGYMVNGITFDTRVVSDGGAAREGDVWTGLVVFEAPMKTDDPTRAAENVANAQDRMGALVKLLDDTSNRYVPSLLVLTWEDETLESLAERLDISEEVDAFENRDLVYLAGGQHDAELIRAVENVVTSEAVKDSVVVHLQLVVQRVEAYLQRYMDVAALLLAKRPEDIPFIWNIFQNGIQVINAVPVLVREAIGPNGLGDGTSFQPLVLPGLPVGKPSSAQDVVDVVAEWFDNDELRDGSLALGLASLSGAAAAGRPLPIIFLLNTLAALVLAELQTLQLVTRAYVPYQTGTHEWVSHFVEGVQSRYSELVEERVSVIAAVAASPPPTPKVKAPWAEGSPQSSPEKTAAVNGGVNGGKAVRKKRARGEKNESKAAKTAKLAKLMSAMDREWGLGNQDLAV
ncbi:hypothetical protein IAT38_004160 [Cryptococcus sp. DSM 104549]